MKNKKKIRNIKMLHRVKRFLVKKATQSAVGKAVRWGFWSLLIFCPGAMLTTVGVSGLVVTAATVHSGVIEYGASTLLAKKMEE